MSRTKIAALLVLAGIAVTGGSAFTDAISGAPAHTYIGSTSTAVDAAAAASSITYTYDADYTHVASVAVVITGNTAGHHLFVVPNVSGTPGAAIDCGAGVHTTDTAYTCTVATASDWLISGLGSVGFTLTN